MASSNSTSTTRLILVPAVITLIVTFLRLYGELHDWSPLFFNRSAGGGLAIVGISWLPVIFGPYFGLKLVDAGRGPTGAGKTVAFAVIGLVVAAGGSFVAFNPKPLFPGAIIVGLLLLALAVAVQFNPWRSLAETLVAYGYAARIPVAIIMYFAISGGWGTHYDAAPPQGAPTAFWPRYIELGLIPQLIFWVVYTVVVGALFAGIVVAIMRRGRLAPSVS